MLRSSHPRAHLSAFSAVFAVLCAAQASAQVTLSVAIKEGDPVPGVGNLTTIDAIAVNNAGTWVVEGDTDNLTTTIDQVVVRSGALASQQGQALAAPAGATISSFGSGGAPINSSGHWGWNYFLGGLTTSTDSGIFFDNTLVIQEGTISSAPQFSAGTPYIGFFGARLNDSNQILFIGSIDDVAIASTVDRALVIAGIDSLGTLLSETVVAKEGDLLAGQTEAIADFATGPHGTDFNASGDVLFIADLNGATTADGVVYLNGTLLAQEGASSPAVGRTWSSLSTSQRVALNNNGDYAYTGTLSAPTTDDAVIVVNNVIAVQEGQVPPGITGFTLTGFGSAPIDLDDAGHLYWYGDWNDPDTTKDTGIFRDNQLLVQEGVTLIGGQLLTAIAGVQENLCVSPNGEWLIFEGELAGGIAGAFLVHLPPSMATYCTAGTTSNGCMASISGAGTPDANAGSGFTITVVDVEGAQTGILFYGVSGPNADPWGSGTSFLCVKAPLERMGVLNSGGTPLACDGVLSVDWNTYIATNPSAVGSPFTGGETVWAQGWFRDPPSPKTTSLSDALTFTVVP